MFILQGVVQQFICMFAMCKGFPFRKNHILEMGWGCLG